MLIVVEKDGRYSGIAYEEDTRAIREHHTSQGQFCFWDTRPIPEIDPEGTTPVPFHPDWNTPAWDALLNQDAIGQLWNAAHAFQNTRIDANGVAAMIHKVGQEGSHTKATANIEWWQGLWSDYEVRRQKILSGVEYSLDFSNNGDIPFRVHDAMAE